MGNISVGVSERTFVEDCIGLHYITYVVVVYIVPLSQQPLYNDKRRSRVSMGTLARIQSYPQEMSSALKKQMHNHAPLNPSIFAQPGEYVSTVTTSCATHTLGFDSLISF